MTSNRFEFTKKKASFIAKQGGFICFLSKWKKKAKVNDERIINESSETRTNDK